MADELERRLDRIERRLDRAVLLCSVLVGALFLFVSVPIFVAVLGAGPQLLVLVVLLVALVTFVVHGRRAARRADP